MDFKTDNLGLLLTSCGQAVYGGIKPDVKDYYVFHYIIKGSGYIKHNGLTQKINAGQTFFIYKETLTEYYPDSKDPWEYIWVCFIGKDVKRLIGATDFSQSNLVSPILPPEQLDIYTDILKAAGNNLTVSDNIQSYCETTSLLYKLFAFYIKYYPAKEKIDNKKDVINSAVAYISENLNNPELSVDNISAYLGIHRTTLYRQFTENLNVSPKDYILNRRMHLAWPLLNKTDYSINDIAASLGFSNQMYFCRVFKAKTGITPTQYRKKSRMKK